MTDLQKLIRIYTADRGIQVMALLAAGGLTLAIAQRDAKVLPLFALGWALYIVEEYLIHRSMHRRHSVRHCSTCCIDCTTDTTTSSGIRTCSSRHSGSRCRWR